MAPNIQNPIRDSAYYMHTGKLPLASKVSFYVRRKMFTLFMEAMCPTKETSILDLGVTSDNKYQESNYFEQFYPYNDKVVCAGTEDGSQLEQGYPGITSCLPRPTIHCLFPTNSSTSYLAMPLLSTPEDEEDKSSLSGRFCE